MDWFLYDNGLRHKRVNEKKRFMFLSKRLCTIEHKIMTGFSKRNSVFGAINWINIFFLAFYIPLLGLYSCITFLKLKNDKVHKSDVNTLPMFFYGQALHTISPCSYQQFKPVPLESSRDCANDRNNLPPNTNQLFSKPEYVGLKSCI